MGFDIAAIGAAFADVGIPVCGLTTGRNSIVMII